MSQLLIRNRQRVRRVRTAQLRRIAQSILNDLPGVREYELCVHLVGAVEMTQVNEQFLGHEGSTDVITFDYTDKPATSPARLPERLHGEIFICLDDAVAQARRFRTTWQAEVTRYLIHGLLHLRGYTDTETASRRRMKREEQRRLQRVKRGFDLSLMRRASKVGT